MRQRSHNPGSIKEIKHTNPTLNPEGMDHRRIIVKTLLKRSGENSKNIVKKNTQNTLQKDFILVTHSKPVDNSTTTKVIDTNTMKCELIVEKVHLKLFMSN